MKDMDLSVYFITSNEFGYSHEEIALMALKAGIKTIQFREKRMSAREMLRTAKNLRELCDNFDATFIVNDRVDIALLSDADGVHAGQDDLPAEEIRRIFDGIIGTSVSSVEEAVKAEEHADYLGAGPVFFTKTKKDAGNAIGIEGLKRIVDAVSIPVVGIGSINSRNVMEVIMSGVSGVAIISGIASAENPEFEGRKILEMVRLSREL
jgi:thiamine-phosphate pyrophosphorylase